MKTILSHIEATKSNIKLHFTDGQHTEFMSYINALNFIYGYKMFTDSTIKVIPSNLIIEEKEFNSIVAALDKHFCTIIGYRPEFKKDLKDHNNSCCCAFDIYGQSSITLVRQ